MRQPGSYKYKPWADVFFRKLFNFWEEVEWRQPLEVFAARQYNLSWLWDVAAVVDRFEMVCFE